SVVLPSPGGPKNSTWSIASPRLRAASMNTRRFSRAASCPTNSPSDFGRSAASWSSGWRWGERVGLSVIARCLAPHLSRNKLAMTGGDGRRSENGRGPLQRPILLRHPEPVSGPIAPRHPEHDDRANLEWRDLDAMLPHE